MHPGVQNHGGMDHKLFSKFERVLTGHFHTKSTIDNITYLGTQLELSGQMHMIRSISIYSIQIHES